jgi:hypothetical protein
VALDIQIVDGDIAFYDGDILMAEDGDPCCCGCGTCVVGEHCSTSASLDICVDDIDPAPEVGDVVIVGGECYEIVGGSCSTEPEGSAAGVYESCDFCACSSCATVEHCIDETELVVCVDDFPTVDVGDAVIIDSECYEVKSIDFCSPVDPPTDEPDSISTDGCEACCDLVATFDVECVSTTSTTCTFDVTINVSGDYAAEPCELSYSWQDCGGGSTDTARCVRGFGRDEVCVEITSSCGCVETFCEDVGCGCGICEGGAPAQIRVTLPSGWDRAYPPSNCPDDDCDLLDGFSITMDLRLTDCEDSTCEYYACEYPADWPCSSSYIAVRGSAWISSNGTISFQIWGRNYSNCSAPPQGEYVYGATSSGAVDEGCDAGTYLIPVSVVTDGINVTCDLSPADNAVVELLG